MTAKQKFESEWFATIEKAAEKGYDDFGGACFKMTTGLHALGEIWHKVVRFIRKKDPEDLMKIASWVYVYWCYERGLEPLRDADKEIPLVTGIGSSVIGSLEIATTDARDKAVPEAPKSIPVVHKQKLEKERVKWLPAD